ncbi:MAG TPA: MFS transporter [Pseudomonadales bacterium]|nr:MFS transporter [Pseudomonadales bacterium]
MFCHDGPGNYRVIGRVIGSELAPQPSLATLPITLMVVDTALASYPAALTMKRLGRKNTFLIAALCFYKNTPTEPSYSQTSQAQRSAFELISQNIFLIAVAAGTLAFTVMSMVMTVTPISMHVVEHFSVNDTAMVIQSHIIAMYLPSLLSGRVISRLGIGKTLVLGAVISMLCSMVVLLDRRFIHYWAALVLLGLGWNLLFMAGTAALTKTHQDNEKFTAQAINEAAIFICQAVATLSAGAIMQLWGWTVIHLINVLLLSSFVFFIVWKNTSFPISDKNKHNPVL